MMDGTARNPLVRDGVTQQQRQVATLSPDFARVDERDLADFLTFTHGLSQQVNYYGLQNQVEGTWQAFFDRSPVVQLALIRKTRPEQIQQKYELARRRYLAQWAITPAAASVSRSQRLGKLGKVFEVYGAILDDLVIWYERLADDTSLKPVIKASIKANLSSHVTQMVRLEQGLIQTEQGVIQQTSSPGLLEEASLQDQVTLSQRRQRLLQREQAMATHFGLPISLGLAPLNGGNTRGLELDLRQLTTNRSQAQFVLDGLFQPLFQTYSQIIQQAGAALQQSLPGDQSLPPHLALLIAFWQVLEPARDDLNRMTERHLDFFYREVLRLAEKPAQPDRAHVIFELAKFQDSHILKGQTPLSAGTDATGADLVYTLTDDLVVNTAQVAEVKGLFRHAQRSATGPPIALGLHESTKADSYDGQGGKFPQDQAVQAWLPFGNEARPTATVGFAIASPLLLLQEGDRTITLTLSFPLDQPPPAKLQEHLQDELRIDFSGAAEWIVADMAQAQIALTPLDSPNPHQLKITVSLPPGSEPVLPYHPELPGGSLLTSHPVMRLVLQHRDSDHASTDSSAAAPDLMAFQMLQQATLRGLTLTTEVTGMRNLLLQSDLGPLEAAKPFQPFGPQPKAGNSFYIGSQEVFQKPLTQLRLSFDLETDPPPGPDGKPDWVQTYAGYRDFSDGIHPFEPGKLAVQGLRDRQWQPPTTAVEGNLFSPLETATEGTTDTADTALESSASESSEAEESEAPGPGYAIDLSDQLAALNLNNFATSPIIPDPPEPWTHQSKAGFLRLQLVGDDFLHSEYPTVLARQVLATATHAIAPDGAAEVAQAAEEAAKKAKEAAKKAREAAEAAEEANKEAKEADAKDAETKAEEAAKAAAAARRRKAVIGAYYYRAGAHPAIAPDSAPLTGDDIFIAQTETVAADEIPVMSAEPYTPVITSLQVDYTAKLEASDTSKPNHFQLFHLHPFEGVAVLHQALTDDSPITLLPQYNHEGELLIGLQDVQPATAIALLFQVAEETADTDLTRTEVTWHYLVDNAWKPLEKHLILNDTTNGLIHPGIVKLAIPPDISNAHTTILNPALHWIKATVKARSGAIGSIVSLHTQAAEVVFTETDNDPHHLDAPLPAETIADLVATEPEIQQILQPYQSFGGKRQEPPARFYTRISEHLRHKGRAITIFDYERLVLEQFPSIHKVRCINHSQAKGKQLYEIAPGHITLAVIPEITHPRTLNDLQPKANINLLADIENYLKSVSSPWASIRVINPRYESLRVTFQVQFRDPYQADFDVYRRQLERDIIGFLSPWTMNENAEIHFGGEMHLSSILNFVEKRPYVDYLINFKLFLNGKSEHVAKASASTAHSILVSVSPDEILQNRHQIEPISGSATIAGPNTTGFGSQPLGQLKVGESTE